LKFLLHRSEPGGDVVDKRTTVGIDLAKEILAVCVLKAVLAANTESVAAVHSSSVSQVERG
jgi:hypothetical protein